ncbi:hypothetical protein HDU91_001509, partial [Kappamyces sp. JEL0680]
MLRRVASLPLQTPKAHLHCASVLRLATPPSRAVFSPALSKEEARHAMENVFKSKRGNPVDVRRTYWYNVYAKVFSQSRCMFVLQNNNLPAQKYKSLKVELRSKGLECLAIRNAVFGAAANNANLPQMRNLFQGPTLVWFSPLSDEQAPNLIQDVSRITQKYKQHLLLVGGCVDGLVLSADTFEDIKKLPPKIVLYGELLGLIS